MEQIKIFKDLSKINIEKQHNLVLDFKSDSIKNVENIACMVNIDGEVRLLKQGTNHLYLENIDVKVVLGAFWKAPMKGLYFIEIVYFTNNIEVFRKFNQLIITDIFELKEIKYEIEE